jgi:hypothetical protein
MTDMVDEKAPLQGLPFSEDDADSNTDSHGRQKQHRFRRVLALFGVTALLLWLSHSWWGGPNAFEPTNNWNPKKWHLETGAESLEAEFDLLGGWPKQNVFDAIDHRDPRKKRIDTGSNSLDAELDLFDLLSIHSTTGSINVGIHPQPADEQNPVPAELFISSHAGRVSVNFHPFNAPERDYHVAINSRHGSVEGAILHGRKTSMVSNSGSLDVQIAPFGSGNYSSSLHTSSDAGSQDLTLLSPSKQPGTSINGMSSMHSSNAGSLVLRYPREWEGMIEGHTRNGNLRLHGGNLDIIRRSSFSASGHYVLARKGNGNSTLYFHTSSGGIDLYFH